MEQLYDIEYLDIRKNKSYNKIIDKVINKCFEEEGLLGSNLTISITLTDSANIKKLIKRQTYYHFQCLKKKN